MEHYGAVKCNVYSLYMTRGACYIIVTGKKDKNCIQRMDINMLKYVFKKPCTKYIKMKIVKKKLGMII